MPGKTLAAGRRQKEGLIVAPSEVESVTRDMAAAYVEENKLANFGSQPEWQRLAVLQNTNVYQKYIQSRAVGKSEVKFLPYQIARKCLNFAFNFRVSCELLKSEYHAVKEVYYDYHDKNAKQGNNGQVIPVKKEREAIECEVDVRFTFKLADGTEIIRDVTSGHKGYKNMATTRADVKKSAMSKAWTRVAASFGIGADLEAIEEVVEEKIPAPEGEQDVFDSSTDLGY